MGFIRGGGVINILNAISDRPDSFLVSIDRVKYFTDDKSIVVGSDANALFPDVKNWELLAGYEPSAVLEKINRKFDFAIIDTSHFHPMETLNFLCALPYLNDGAIVVLHDVALHLMENVNKYATCVLMSSVVAQKVTHDRCGNHEQNIVAFQVTSDTRKYIGNVFDSLFIPWTQAIDKDDINSIRELLSKHYTSKQVEKFDNAYNNVCLWGNCTVLQTDGMQKRYWENASKYKSETIFYGGGSNMNNWLCRLDNLSISFDFAIWDKNASRICELLGHSVSVPNFDGKVDGVKSIVLTICDKRIVKEVREDFERLGYTVYPSIEDFLKAAHMEE